MGSTAPASFPSYYTESRFDTKNVAASWNRTLGPSSTLEIRFGYHEPCVPTVTNNRVVTRADFLKNTGIQMFQADTAFATIPVITVTGQFSASASGVASGDHVYQWVANYGKTFGRHNFRTGVNYSRRWYFYDGSTPMHGTATFDTALTELSTDRNSGHATASFLLGYPANINRGQGDARTDGRQNATQLYVQDDWRATPKLTVNLGLRYELSNPPYDVTDRVGTLQLGRDSQTGKITGTLLWGTVNPLPDPVTGKVNDPARRGGYGRSLQGNDLNNFAPRIGLAYQVDTRTVIRAGVGVFYNSTFMQELQDKRKFYPYNTAQFFSSNTGVLPDLSISDPGPSYENTTAIGGWAQDPGNRTPYSEQWNLFIQRQVGRDNTVEAGYLGSSNHRQIGYIPINTAIVPGSSALQQRRLLPEFGDINGGLNDFASNYHGLQLKGTRRFSKGLAFQVNYTWSRSMDYQSSLAETKTQNPFNRAADYSRSSWDLRHVFQFAYVYEFPLGHGRKFGTAWPRALDYVAGGWAFEGIGRFQTGGPVNVTIGQDRANVGSGTIQRPNVTRNPNLSARSIDGWFDTAAFEMPAAYTYGNAGAYLVDSDGRHNFDMSLAKRFAIRENTFLALRGEFFNFTNSVSFGDPNATLTSSAFGRVTSATAARQVQVSLRLSF